MKSKRGSKPRLTKKQTRANLSRGRLKTSNLSLETRKNFGRPKLEKSTTSSRETSLRGGTTKRRDNQDPRSSQMAKFGKTKNLAKNTSNRQSKANKAQKGTKNTPYSLNTPKLRAFKPGKPQNSHSHIDQKKPKNQKFKQTKKKRGKKASWRTTPEPTQHMNSLSSQETPVNVKKLARKSELEKPNTSPVNSSQKDILKHLGRDGDPGIIRIKDFEKGIAQEIQNEAKKIKLLENSTFSNTELTRKISAAQSPSRPSVGPSSPSEYPTNSQRSSKTQKTEKSEKSEKTLSKLYRENKAQPIHFDIDLSKETSQRGSSTISQSRGVATVAKNGYQDSAPSDAATNSIGGFGRACEWSTVQESRVVDFEGSNLSGKGDLSLDFTVERRKIDFRKKGKIGENMGFEGRLEGGDGVGEVSYGGIGGVNGFVGGELIRNGEKVGFSPESGNVLKRITQTCSSEFDSMDYPRLESGPNNSPDLALHFTKKAQTSNSKNRLEKDILVTFKPESSMRSSQDSLNKAWRQLNADFVSENFEKKIYKTEEKFEKISPKRSPGAPLMVSLSFSKSRPDFVRLKDHLERVAKAVEVLSRRSKIRLKTSFVHFFEQLNHLNTKGRIQENFADKLREFMLKKKLFFSLLSFKGNGADSGVVVDLKGVGVSRTMSPRAGGRVEKGGGVSGRRVRQRSSFDPSMMYSRRFLLVRNILKITAPIVARDEYIKKSRGLRAIQDFSLQFLELCGEDTVWNMDMLGNSSRRAESRASSAAKMLHKTESAGKEQSGKVMTSQWGQPHKTSQLKGGAGEELSVGFKNSKAGLDCPREALNSNRGGDRKFGDEAKNGQFLGSELKTSPCEISGYNVGHSSNKQPGLSPRNRPETGYHPKNEKSQNWVENQIDSAESRKREVGVMIKQVLADSRHNKALESPQNTRNSNPPKKVDIPALKSISKINAQKMLEMDSGMQPPATLSSNRAFQHPKDPPLVSSRISTKRRYNTTNTNSVSSTSLYNLTKDEDELRRGLNQEIEFLDKNGSIEIRDLKEEDNEASGSRMSTRRRVNDEGDESIEGYLNIVDFSKVDENESFSGPMTGRNAQADRIVYESTGHNEYDLKRKGMIQNFLKKQDHVDHSPRSDRLVRIYRGRANLRLKSKIFGSLLQNLVEGLQRNERCLRLMEKHRLRRCFLAMRGLRSSTSPRPRIQFVERRMSLVDPENDEEVFMIIKEFRRLKKLPKILKTWRELCPSKKKIARMRLYQRSHLKNSNNSKNRLNSFQKRKPHTSYALSNQRVTSHTSTKKTKKMHHRTHGDSSYKALKEPRMSYPSRTSTTSNRPRFEAQRGLRSNRSIEAAQSQGRLLKQERGSLNHFSEKKGILRDSKERNRENRGSREGVRGREEEVGSVSINSRKSSEKAKRGRFSYTGSRSGYRARTGQGKRSALYKRLK